MALQQTAWLRVIFEQFFADNAFLLRSLNWNEFVQKGIKTVTVPQAGTVPGYERNRTSVPATIVQRADSDLEFTMVDYTSNPQLVTELETMQLSYDKMLSVVKMMLANIKDGVANDMLYAWRPTLAASIIPTTGEAADSTLPGSTGQRKRLTFRDFAKAVEHFNRINAPKGNRNFLLPSGLYTDLLLDPMLKDKLNEKVVDYSNGLVGTLLGCNVYERSSTLVVSNAGVIKTPTASLTPAVTDSEAVVFWCGDMVGRSVGNIAVYADEKPRPEMYGKVMSSQMQAGGTKVYADGKGVGMIVPTTPA